MRSIILLVCVCSLISACQNSPRKNYYLLSAEMPEQHHVSGNITTLIGIGPIEVAEYLNRSHLVYQDEGGRLIMADNDYWAEPLRKGIPRVLALNLTHNNPERSVVNFPWRRDSAPRYSVRLTIQSLDRMNNHAHINATWELVDNTEKAHLLRRHFIRTTPVDAGAASLTKAYSQLLKELAVEINEALNQHITVPE
jgi:uncharacterized lipoprotein YmbA